MYESFYGFRERPFSLLPDPSFLYLGHKHRVALTMLQYGLMSNAGFTVITGEIGSGKTTLIVRSSMSSAATSPSA
jgi:type II secretory pathway predicted ATPase ExeA